MQERKVGRKYLWQVFGWREERRKYQLDPGIFSLTSPKCFLPKMGRKLREKISLYRADKNTHAQGHMDLLFLCQFWLFFFFVVIKKKNSVFLFCVSFPSLFVCFCFWFFFFFGTFHYFIIITIIIFEAHLPLTCAPFKKNSIHHFLTKKMCYFLFYLIRI